MTTFAALAVIATAFRTWLRLRKRHIWWDDAWAIFSMVTQLTLLTGLWIRTDTPGAFIVSGASLCFRLMDVFDLVP